MRALAAVPKGRLQVTASGHLAGLQSGDAFGSKERSIKAVRDQELAKSDPKLSGADAETTYRDKKGKKLDMLSEFMRQQAVQEGKVGVTRASYILKSINLPHS
jgi:hypothetical protein